jgi:hypothetical protein
MQLCIRRSKFPGNMHNYIWCPYYLPSFVKFYSVVSEELRWQTVWRTDGQTNRTKTICLPTKVGGDIILPVNILMLKYNISKTYKCVYCHEVETLRHLFFECTFNSQLLLLIKNWIFALSNGIICLN